MNNIGIPKLKSVSKQAWNINQRLDQCIQMYSDNHSVILIFSSQVIFCTSDEKGNLSKEECHKFKKNMQDRKWHSFGDENLSNSNYQAQLRRKTDS